MKQTQENASKFYAKVVELRDLPPIQLEEKEEAHLQITRYLLKLIEMHTHSQSHRIPSGLLIPSLNVLAQFFNRSYREIQHSLRTLEEEGFDSFTPGLYGQISLWDPIPKGP